MKVNLATQLIVVVLTCPCLILLRSRWQPYIIYLIFNHLHALSQSQHTILAFIACPTYINNFLLWPFRQHRVDETANVFMFHCEYYPNKFKYIGYGGAFVVSGSWDSCLSVSVTCHTVDCWPCWPQVAWMVNGWWPVGVTVTVVVGCWPVAANGLRLSATFMRTCQNAQTCGYQVGWES